MKSTLPTLSRTAALPIAVLAFGAMGFALEPGRTDDGGPATLEELEELIENLTERVDAAVVEGTPGATVEIFGRIHTDAWAFSDTDGATNVFETGDPDADPKGRLEFRRARIGASGWIDARMLYKFEIDFGNPDELEIKDVFVGFDDLPLARRLLVGNQKRPYGLDHLNSSRFNVFTTRPMIVEALNEDARRPGIMSYGKSADLAWNWRIGIFSAADVTATGEYVGDGFEPEVAARLAHTAYFEGGGRRYLHLAVAGSLARPRAESAAAEESNASRFRTAPEARTEQNWIDTGRIAGIDGYGMAGVEAVWNEGPTQVVAEWMGAAVGREGASQLGFGGGYVQVAHFLTGEFMPWNRSSGTLDRPEPHRSFAAGTGPGAWQVALRYSFADFSDDDVRGGRGEAVTLGLNWHFNANASLQVNYAIGSVSERQVVSGGTTFREGDYRVLGLRLRADF